MGVASTGLRLHEFRGGNPRATGQHEDKQPSIKQSLARCSGVLPSRSRVTTVFVALKPPAKASLHHVLLFLDRSPIVPMTGAWFGVPLYPTRLNQALAKGIGRRWCGQGPLPSLRPDMCRALPRTRSLAFHKAVTEEQVRVLYRGRKDCLSLVADRNSLRHYELRRVRATLRPHRVTALAVHCASVACC